MVRIGNYSFQNARMEVINWFVRRNPTPQIIAKQHFDEVVAYAEKRGHTFSPKVKERTWNFVSEAKIERLRGVMSSEFDEKVYKNIPDEKMEKLLKVINKLQLKLNEIDKVCQDDGVTDCGSECHCTNMMNDASMKDCDVYEALKIHTLNNQRYAPSIIEKIIKDCKEDKRFFIDTTKHLMLEKTRPE